MKRTKILGFILIASLLAAVPATAQPKPGKGKRSEPEQRDRGRAPERDRDREHDRRQDEHRGFSEIERQRIQFYCERYGAQEGKHRRPLPPGLAKKVARGRNLPPGWADHCVPGRVLPVEVYRECKPLPPELVVRLPAPPVGTVTVAIDGRVVRILKATREILDVFDIHVRF